MKPLICLLRINKVSHLLSHNLILSHLIPVLFHLILSTKIGPRFVAIPPSGSDVYLTVYSGRVDLFSVITCLLRELSSGG